MASKMRGGSHAQHVKAGKQSHKNDTKSRSSRGGQSAQRSRSSEPVTMPEGGAQQIGGGEPIESDD